MCFYSVFFFFDDDGRLMVIGRQRVLQVASLECGPSWIAAQSPRPLLTFDPCSSNRPEGALNGQSPRYGRVRAPSAFPSQRTAGY